MLTRSAALLSLLMTTMLSHTQASHRSAYLIVAKAVLHGPAHSDGCGLVLTLLALAGLPRPTNQVRRCSERWVLMTRWNRERSEGYIA
jgi:hypothetical protein